MNGVTSRCSHSVVLIVPTTSPVRAVLAVVSVSGGQKMLDVPEEGGEF
jgi:hypothetical protein